MEITKNSFEGGLDTNMSHHLITPNKYIQAANVNIAANGKFFALENIKGTTEVAIIDALSDEYNVLALFANQYKIGNTVNIPCLTVIATADELLKVWCYDTINDDLYELYEQQIDSGVYLQADRLVDGILYPEAGLDILYFTDNFYKIRKLRCEIPVSYTPNFLTELDVQMQRRGAKGLVELTEIVEGGSLFSGSYQIAYQLINPGTNQFTKFSLFCNPIHVFLKPTDAFDVAVKSGVGLQSNYKIRFNINLSEEEAAYYTHFRLAVLENIEPSGVNVELAQLTPIELMSTFLSGAVLEDVEYNANMRLENINIAEIVVDLMALDHVKALAVRQNRILGGNVTLKELDYDNGEPAITGGSVIKESSTITKNSFADPVFASKYRGHFRNEVYRYSISYFDEDMNFSFPKVLDLSTIQFNQLGIDPITEPTDPELVPDPSFNSGASWPAEVYTDDDPVNNEFFVVSGGEAAVTFSSSPLSSHYIRSTIVLDNTKTYKYIANYTTTGFVQVPYISFWNNGTRLDEFILSHDGTFVPPASTTHIGLRVLNAIGTGVLTFQDISIKEANAEVIPPQAVTGFDMKFPSRAAVLNGESFTLFDEDGRIQSLGLQLTGIDNHPTWARGFVILRAKRVKDILFQTPLIPLNQVYGVGAIEEYPTLANELSGTGRRTLEYPNAQPMGPFTTYVPRNYHWKSAQDIRMYSITGGASGGGLNKKFTGESYLVKNPAFILGMIFPPEFMYEDKPFLYSPNHNIVTVDAMLARKGWSDFSELSIGSQVHGRNIKTSVSGTFHGLEDARYYYNSTHGGVKPVLATDNILSDYKEFTNLGEGDSIAGYNVFRYDKLDTSGIFWGTKANVHKAAVIKLDSTKQEINNNSSLSFAIGAQQSKAADASLAFDLEQNNVQTFEIVNVTAGLEDTRYGKVETPHEFIFTGTMVTFTEAELVDVRAGTSLPKDVEVWGGDCYVTPHLFKISDTSYGLSNSEKFENLGGLDLLNGVRNWEKSFNDLEIASECNISIPVPYRNAAQYLQVVMESEYNAGVIDNEIINVPTTYNDDFPIYSVNSGSEGSARVPLTYQLNANHKKQNSDKIFRLRDPLLETNNLFKARLIYSDQKVYQTSINGFDVFRVLNFYDLEETHGQIHSLATAADDLYVLQERGVAYIGIGERLLETTEALQLSVQSGSYIGNVMYIDVDRGTQHIKSVLKTGTSIYFVDNRNKTFNRVAGKNLDVLSESTVATTFRELLENSLPENSIRTFYDPTHKQIWVTGSTFCYVFDEARNTWVSAYDFPEGALKGAAYIGQKLYLVEQGDDLKIHTMYSGVRGQLFGTDVTPSVTSIINPGGEIGKVFDAILVPVHNQLGTFDITVVRSNELTNQEIFDHSINTNTRAEGNYRAKILRDDSDARLRGLYAMIKLKWHNNSSVEYGDIGVALPSFLTKFRLSENRF